MPRLRAWAPAAPLLLYLAAFLVQPSLYAVKLSFTDTLTGRFPSLANFRLVTGDGLFWRALAGNVLLPAAIVAVEVAGGLALAVLLAARLPGRRLLRAIVVVPFALPPLGAGVAAFHVSVGALAVNVLPPAGLVTAAFLTRV